MDVDKTIRLGGGCSVWGCEDPIVAEALCSTHLAFNSPPKAPGPDSTVQRPLHRARRARRFALGRALARSTKIVPQQTPYSPNQKDASLAHFGQQLPTPPATHQFTDQSGLNHASEHPSVPAPANAQPSRQSRATVKDVNASAIAATVLPRRPREPYFVLNPDTSSTDKNYSAFPPHQTAGDLPEGRQAPKKASPEENSALVDELVQAGLEFASTFRLSFVQTASATQENPLAANPSVRVGGLNVENLSSITVANTPSRKRSKAVESQRREPSTMGLFQEPDQHSQSVGDNPLQLSSKKRTAAAAGVQPRIQEPSHALRQEANSTSSAPERQRRLRSSARPNDGNQAASLGGPSEPQSSRLSDDQTTSHSRNSKRIRTSNDPIPVIDIAQAKANRRLASLDRAQGETSAGIWGDGSSPNSQEPQQLTPREIGSRDEREAITVPLLSTAEEVVTVEEQTTPAAGQSAAQELGRAKVRVFDSEAFDAMIYRQSSLRPPPEVSRQSAARPKTPAQIPSTGDQRLYLAVNPAIHLLHNRSDEWYKQKALEIQGRGGRKAWFGKVIERRRWIRAKERAEEERRNTAKTPNKKPKRVDPQPWSYDRIMDFGDVPEEELPEDVLQNPAWVKACAWHREVEAKKALRDRAARAAHREAWNYAKSIMRDGVPASEGSRGPSKQR